MSKSKRIIKNYTPLLKIKNNLLSIETECIFGEKFTVLDESSKWSYGYLNNDKYYGWVRSNCIAHQGKPDFCVVVPRTFILDRPKTKSLTMEYLSLGSIIRVNKMIGEWAEIFFLNNNITKTGYIPKRHLISINAFKRDWVSVAESMLGVPYKWGGKTSFGIDCSGLLQISLKLAGKTSPRNSSDQQLSLGSDVFSKSELELKYCLGLWNKKVRRGDIIFWKGHVGIINTNSTILHANTNTQNVAIQNSKNLIKNYFKKGLIPLAIKRLE